MAADLNDSSARAARAQAVNGAHRLHTSSRKYALTTAASTVILPTWDDGRGRGERRPDYIKLNVGSAVVYGSLTEQAAAIPTTGADGTELIGDGQVIAIWTADRISLIAEASATITISYYWT